MFISGKLASKSSFANYPHNDSVQSDMCACVRMPVCVCVCVCVCVLQ